MIDYRSMQCLQGLGITSLLSFILSGYPGSIVRYANPGNNHAITILFIVAKGTGIILISLVGNMGNLLAV